MKKPWIVARCGDVQNAPESTLPAFERAIAQGADAIEFDVHPTRDGALVIHHDFYLGRTSNGTGYIGDSSLAELRALDAGGWFAPEFAGERIPTLAEVLACGKGRTRFEIDMKGSSRAFLEQVVDTVARFGLLDQAELTSAHTPLLLHARQLDPRLRTGMFFYPLPGWMEPALGQKHILDWLSLADAQVAHLHASLLEEAFVARLQAHGFWVHGSNLNTEEELQNGMSAGVDQFSTDRLGWALSRIKASI